MRRVVIVAVLAAACRSAEEPPVPVLVPEPAEATTRAPAEEARVEPAPAEQGGDVDPAWLKHLRRVCDEVTSPEERKTRHTDGWETYKDKIAVKVSDLRIWSPVFGKWSLTKIDADKTAGVTHRGPYYGYGLTVELENKSDQVLDADNVYVWATFKSKAGERTCFADARDSRSWNPFARKGAGDWVRETEYPEWPLRPGERKRYTVNRPVCFESLWAESEPTEVTVDVYARFNPLGKDMVIAGPLASFKRPGDLLRGVPLGGSDQIVQRIDGKALKAVRALYMAGDQVLTLDDKKATWIPQDQLQGLTPEKPPVFEAMPKSPEAYKKGFGSLTLTIGAWKVAGWRTLAGAVKSGRKLVSANVGISVDTASVKSTLEAAVTAAQGKVAETSGDVTAKEAAATVADGALASAAGTDGEAAAKEAAAKAKADLKAAQAAQKDAAKALAAAEKAMTGGVADFLKTQAKAVDCGSFRLEVGRASLKPFKGSFGAAECKALLGGAPANGTISFELERWDMPFALTWAGTGGALQSLRTASQELGGVQKE